MDKPGIWLFQLREKMHHSDIAKRNAGFHKAHTGWNLGKDLDLSFQVTKELSQEKKTAKYRTLGEIWPEGREELGVLRNPTIGLGF